MPTPLHICRLPSYKDWHVQQDGRLIIKGLLVPAQALPNSSSSSSSSSALNSSMCDAVLTARLQLPGDGDVLMQTQTSGEVQLRLVSQPLEKCKVSTLLPLMYTVS